MLCRRCVLKYSAGRLALLNPVGELLASSDQLCLLVSLEIVEVAETAASVVIALTPGPGVDRRLLVCDHVVLARLRHVRLLVILYVSILPPLPLVLVLLKLLCALRPDQWLCIPRSHRGLKDFVVWHCLAFRLQSIRIEYKVLGAIGLRVILAITCLQIVLLHGGVVRQAGILSHASRCPVPDVRGLEVLGRRDRVLHIVEGLLKDL